MRGRCLILNADDFGQDSAVNRAILESFRKGWCSSATLMANRAGFEEACQMIHENRLLQQVGIHLVLRSGAALTQPVRKFERFCDLEGNLCLKRAGPLPILFFRPAEKKVLADELRAQIQRCRQRGILLTHADSHYHLHNEWAVASIVLSVLKQEQVPFLRIARNCGTEIGLPKRLYKEILNQRIRSAGMAATTYFGSVEDYLFWKQSRSQNIPSASFEVMIHPQMNQEGTLVDSIENRSLEKRVQQVEGYSQAVSFSGVRFQ